MIAPYYSRAGITLYHDDLREVVPHLEERGIILMDPPYSPHVHSKSRAGAREVPLRAGDGKLYRASFCRAVDFGFEPLSDELRDFIARQCARLASRFVLQFSDKESDHLWRASLLEVGLEYHRTAIWHKKGSTPQMNGRIPAVAAEAITICHQVDVPGGAQWNGHGRHGWYDYTHESRDFEEFCEHGGDIVYEVPIVLERPGGHEPRVHTTQKPIKLITQLVEDFSDPGELLYDWTAGFSTLAIAALRAEGGPRRAVLVERDERWCEASAKRIDAEIAGTGYTPEMVRGQVGLFA